jgi:ABC-2 type transport system ATP-binding protein
MDPLLQVTDLSHRFGSVPALSQLSFSLARGEVLGLLGPNGAGKTTCLQLLSGNLAPSRGRVLIDGIDLARRPLAAKARVGYLPEQAPIYPHMWVDEYLAHAARLRRLPRRQVGPAVEHVKALCGLRRVGRRLLGKLSKGYRQRAGIAQALVHAPDLVILDEPTDGLDPVQIRDMRALIRDLAGRCGIVLSSHALTEVQAVCSRVIILRDGRALHQSELHAGSQQTVADDAAKTLFVRLARPPAPAELLRLPAVAGLEAAGEDGFRIQLAAAANSEMLAAMLVERGFGLVELTTPRSDLERMFFASIGAEAAT